MLKKYLAWLFFALLFFSQSAFAAGPEEQNNNGVCEQWGLNIWGLSYHTKKDVGFNNENWGLGGRCYTDWKWGWFGDRDHSNRVFVQGDAIRNSYYGLLVPISLGTEYTIKTFSGSCRILATGALTLAYYKYSDRYAQGPELKFGPVPELSVGCKRVQANVTVVPKASRPALAAVTASVTILFGSSR